MKTKNFAFIFVFLLLLALNSCKDRKHITRGRALTQSVQYHSFSSSEDDFWGLSGMNYVLKNDTMTRGIRIAIDYAIGRIRFTTVPYLKDLNNFKDPNKKRSMNKGDFFCIGCPGEEFIDKRSTINPEYLEIDFADYGREITPFFEERAAGVVNSFIKEHKTIRKLGLVLPNIKLMKIDLNKMLKDVKTIDTLIIRDRYGLHELKYDSTNNICSEFPVEILGEMFESVKCLAVRFALIKQIPKEIFRKKNVPLESLILFCDSLESIDVLYEQNNLKSLGLWCTKRLKNFNVIYSLKHLNSLSVNGTRVTKFSDSLLKLTELRRMVFENNENLRDLPKNILCLPKLNFVQIAYSDRRKPHKFIKSIKRQFAKYPSSKRTHQFCLWGWQLRYGSSNQLNLTKE